MKKKRNYQQRGSLISMPVVQAVPDQITTDETKQQDAPIARQISFDNQKLFEQQIPLSFMATEISPMNLMSTNASSNYLLQPSLFDQESTPQATDINQLQFMKHHQQSIHQSSSYTNIFDQYNESNIEYAPNLDHQMSSY
jgi:hypothetical protein